MRITGPVNPINLSRVYGASGAARASRPAGARSTDTAGRIDQINQTERSINTRLSRLVAGVVAGSIEFEGGSARPTTGATPFYRRPAERNAVATTIQIGQRLDTTG